MVNNNNKNPIDGFVDERFKKVEQAFRRNFSNNWEAEGAAFAVYYNGEKVVDIWGGFADRSCKRLWKYDTLTTGYSTTKSVSSICLAILVDRKLASYDDLVTKYWPEFGKNGKENVTINMLLGHQAGLAFLDGVLTNDEIVSWEKIGAKFEWQKPFWEPGTRTGYHVVTFGWLVDQLVRRLDPQKRSVGQFFREEIGQLYDLDYHIGLPRSLHGRCARLGFPGPIRTVREFLHDPTIALTGLFYLNPIPVDNNHFARIRRNMRCLGQVCNSRPLAFEFGGAIYANDMTMFNNPDLREIEMPAANGVSTARDLAKIHSLVVEGKLLTAETIDLIRKPKYPHKFDHTLGIFDSKGYGFMYGKSPRGDWQCGHMGVGGQNVKMDFEQKLAFAYVTNGLKAGCGNHTKPFRDLQSALYRCLDDI